MPMSLTTRLLITVLALVTLSMSPRESFAGPLQDAIHGVPPDWLIQRSPRRTHHRVSCGKKVLLGLAIGAGAGAAWGTALSQATDGGKGAIVTGGALFGVVGMGIGAALCR
jgi:hypothetical protein